MIIKDYLLMGKQKIVFLFLSEKPDGLASSEQQLRREYRRRTEESSKRETWCLFQWKLRIRGETSFSGLGKFKWELSPNWDWNQGPSRNPALTFGENTSAYCTSGWGRAGVMRVRQKSGCWWIKTALTHEAGQISPHHGFGVTWTKLGSILLPRTTYPWTECTFVNYHLEKSCSRHWAHKDCVLLAWWWPSR